MNKKKIAITILLSAILAFLVTLSVFNFPKKPKTIEKQINEEAQVQQEVQVQTEDKEQEKVEIKEPAKEISKSVKKEVAPTVKTTAKKTENTVPQELNKKAEEATVLEEHVEENIDGVVVPVRYVSNNIYKYTYTPKRYPKKK